VKTPQITGSLFSRIRFLNVGFFSDVQKTQLVNSNLSPFIGLRFSKMDKVELREIMPTIAETWRQEGIEIGLQQGREEGRKEGRLEQTARIALRLLQKRLGRIDEAAQAQIRSLAFEQLEQLSAAISRKRSPNCSVSWIG
jgi:predicted transposase YdaD